MKQYFKTPLLILITAFISILIFASINSFGASGQADDQSRYVEFDLSQNSAPYYQVCYDLFQVFPDYNPPPLPQDPPPPDPYEPLNPDDEDDDIPPPPPPPN